MLYNQSAYREYNIKDIGLYRDDGFMVMKKSTNFKIGKIRKLIHIEFKCLNLKDTINTKLKK